MAKGLGKHSFLKSVEEYENRGVKVVRFVAKSEGAEIGRAGAGETLGVIARKLLIVNRFVNY